ncbi:MAG: triose-phosphate isomerase [Parcubacteria group bacterium CG11_big_fil_rev_8_21_14_0_20_39_22]|nr:MAG: triose-phosphate isomerase [Parcubacteria group bacterium CG11_big_fil_rev_8_21_14_0_20_39_22]
MKAKKIVIGNWKMSPHTRGEAKSLFDSVKKKVTSVKKTNVVVCPPFVFLGMLAGSLRSKNISLGGQDVFYKSRGSHTGEVSADMLSDSRAEYVIVGHSERRALGEDDEIVAKKAIQAVTDGLSVIICIGEDKRDESGKYLSVLSEELKNSLYKFPQQHLNKLIVAYEPIWAIGKTTFDAMSPADIEGTVIFIRKTLSLMYGKERASTIPIIYGGSVTVGNAKSLITDGGISGFLVGHESLIASNFNEIISIVEHA